MRCCSKHWKQRWCLVPVWLLALCLTVPAAGAAVTSNAAPVFHGSLKAAVEGATSDQTLVLLIFGAEWCQPCKLLKKNTLSAPGFLDQAGSLHIAHVDVDADEPTARAYDVSAIPNLILLTPDYKIISRQTGVMTVKELLAWLNEGRKREKLGQWEGTAPGAKMAEFNAKAAADRLEAGDLAKLVALLGAADPAERSGASKLLLDQRELAMPQLLDAVTNSYLGVRIGASELLRQMAPESPALDPWQSPAELTETSALLRKWWATTDRLTTPTNTPTLDPAAAGAINVAISTLRGNNPVRRTEAMSLLLAHGTAALPSVREAIRASEKNGDQRTLALLEDVRWALLVPDTLEERAGNIRNVLARGKGLERQEAAARLGHAGRAAFPALAELLHDSDPLVIESAVRALSSIGGKDAIPAMAALLKAADGNIRMTAAKALGQTKNTAAISELLTVLNDPNEVVACTALAAIEEIYNPEQYSTTKRTQPPEVIKALKTALADPRWRVRSLSAEVLGKLKVNEAIPELTKALDDTDAFVVKSALGALCNMGAAPAPEKVNNLARRLPSLRPEAVELLVKWGSEDAVKAVTEIYDASPLDTRVTILRSLNPGEERIQKSAAWQPFLERVLKESEARLRRAAAEALSGQPATVAAALLGPLLTDEDAETRMAGAQAVLCVLGGERSRQAHSLSQQMMVMAMMQEELESNLLPSGKKVLKTNAPPASAEQIAAWHISLEKLTNSAEVPIIAAFYVTGPTNQHLALLGDVLARANKEALGQFAQSAGLAAILPRLPWPEGQPILETLAASPPLFLKALGYGKKMPSGIVDFLWNPARFRQSVAPASPEDLEIYLPLLLSTEQKEWSLLSGSTRTQPVVAALLESTNAAWRAAAIYALSQRDDEKNLPIYKKAVKDSNPWVRASAALGLVRTLKERPVLEQELGPLLSDTNRTVVERAVLGLLEPETRAAAGLGYEFNYFLFDKIHAWGGSFEGSSDQRPLAVLETKPAFLDSVRQRLAGASLEDLATYSLLLAQYGDFTGLGRLLENLARESDSKQYENMALAQVSLSRDRTYLPFVKKLAVTAKDESNFRRLLQALKGMNGPEARELRLEINRRMRQGSQSSN